MKPLTTLVIVNTIFSIQLKAQIGIGTTDIDPSAVVELKSTDKGFLPPRMTANQRLSITNPTNGLMVYCTNCCETGRLNFYNGSSWKSVVPCLDIDSDNDGVINSVDLDDDNDGILDTDEGTEVYATSNPTAFNQVSGTGSNIDVHVNDVYLYEDFLTIDGQNYDMRAEILEISLGANTADKYSIGMSGSGVPTLGYKNLEATQNDFYRIEFSFIEANSISISNPEGIIVSVPNGSAIIADIESSGGENVSEIGGIGRETLLNNPINPSEISHVNINPTSEINGSFWNSTTATSNLSDLVLITMRKDLNGNVNNWTDEGTIDNASTRPNVEFKYDAFSSLEMIFGVTGSQNGAPSRNMTFTIGSLYNINTDNLDDENHLDVDSDNDGCFDAIEGDGGFTALNINPAGQLLGTVGANGVPTIAGSGQGIGDSQVVGVCP